MCNETIGKFPFSNLQWAYRYGLRSWINVYNTAMLYMHLGVMDFCRLDVASMEYLSCDSLWWEHGLSNFLIILSKLSRTRGVHSMNLLHSKIVHGILKNIPNFTKYWKIPLKIVLLNPPPNIPFQLRIPLVAPRGAL